MYVLYIHRSLSTSLCLDEPQLQAAENLYDLKDYLESPMVHLQATRFPEIDFRNPLP